MKRVMPVAAMLLCSLSVFAQPTDAIQNWTAPPYWMPPAVSPENADQSGRSAPASGRQALVTSPVPLPFVAITPCRQYDSRSTTALADNTPRTVTLSGAPCAIPSDAQAVAANITVFNISGAGSNGVFKAGTVSPPTTAWINYPPTETQRANAGVLPLGAAGTIVVQVNQGAGSVDFVVDVFGYYSPLGVVNSLNTLAGDVTLAAGANVSITPSANTLTVSAVGVLTGVTAGTGISVTGGAPSPTVLIPPSGILADRIASGQVVKSLNGLADGVTIAGAGGTTVSTVGSTITVASPPLSGLVLNAYSAKTVGNVLPYSTGCLDFDPAGSSSVRLDLPLPIGAVITGVNVKLANLSAGTISVYLRSVLLPDGGISLDNINSAILISPNNRNSNVPLTGLSTATPVGASFSYYLFASAPAYTGILRFCGASVTFTVN
jgi:hypothetical protein